MDEHTSHELAYKKGYEAGKPKWIPVTERLPKNEKPYEEYLVTVSRSYYPKSSYDPVDSPYEKEYTTATQLSALGHTCYCALVQWLKQPAEGDA